MIGLEPLSSQKVTGNILLQRVPGRMFRHCDGFRCFIFKSKTCMRNEQLIDFFLTVVVDFGVNFAVRNLAILANLLMNCTR